MRCQFCGWDNAEGKDHCEKCNKPLTSDGAAAPSAHDNSLGRKTARQQSAPSFNPKATVRESALPMGAAPAAAHDLCPSCGFPLQEGECANCGYNANPAKAQQPAPSAPKANADKAPAGNPADVRKTVRPQRKGEKEKTFTLTPISEETGQPEGEAIAFEGDSVDLTRNNTAPRNSTITSHTQATLSWADGQWTIEDKSELKTTFVQASGKTPLPKGALILLGNQLFRFDG